MQVILIFAITVDQVWPEVAAGLHDSLMKTGGDMTVGELWQECRSGRSFLVVAQDQSIKAAAVWRAETWPTGVKLRCVALYGKGMSEWLVPMREKATEIAKCCGATSFITEGRRGWERVFPKAKVLRVLYEEPI
jgi:hypothetical protein